jgi:hypothetical protein
VSTATTPDGTRIFCKDWSPRDGQPIVFQWMPGLPRTSFPQISAPEFNKAPHDSVGIHIAGRWGLFS